MSDFSSVLKLFNIFSRFFFKFPPLFPPGKRACLSAQKSVLIWLPHADEILTIKISAISIFHELFPSSSNLCSLTMKIYSKRKPEEGRRILVEIVFLQLNFFLFSTQSTESFPACRTVPEHKNSVENDFPMIFAGISNEVILLPRSKNTKKKVRKAKKKKTVSQAI